MKRKAVQYFSPEYLEYCQKMTTVQIVQFLEDFGQLQAAQTNESILISIKIPKNLLQVFRTQCELKGVKYQTQIKKIMQEWVSF